MIPNWRAGPWIGGAVVGGGIAAMHYIGMAAFEIPGVLIWDKDLVFASIALGALIGAAALPVGLRDTKPIWKYCGAALLTLAIASHHFTAMGAVSILRIRISPFLRWRCRPDSSPSALPSQASPLSCWPFFGVALDVRDRRRSELEVVRIQSLANAAVEGLVLCQMENIITVNDSFSALTGFDHVTFGKIGLARFLPDDRVRAKLFESSNQPTETTLRHADGSAFPSKLSCDR